MDFRETTQTSFSYDEDGHTDAAVISRNRSVISHDRRLRTNAATSAKKPSEIGNNLILKALPAEMQRVLEPALRTVNLTKEQFLYQEGDRLDFIYFPITAVISEFKMLEDGRMVEIAVTGKEGAVGLSSIFSESHVAPNCTQVSQAGTAIRLDTITFEKLLRTDDRLRVGLSRFVDLYIRQISQKAICNMYHSVKERLCTWLLMVQDRSGRTTLNLTHEQIARTLGVYRPSITCIAQELRDSKLINYSRGGISICDRRRIEETACTCYAELGA